jgi:hypothetical protein
MKKGILELIKKIYGSNALSKVLGTRTNVIRLPDNELKQYTNKELNIEAASDKLVQKAKTDINELLAEYPRMNDAEKLIFEGNLTRLGNTLGVIEKKQGPAADVIKFGTSEKVSPEGVMSLTKKTQVIDLKTQADKRKSVDNLIDEYNANQDRLLLSDAEGGTLIGYEEYEQLRKRNKDISKALEDKGISSKLEKKPEAEIISFTNKPDPEDFATGGRVGMAGGGILKLAMKFFNDNNPVSAYKKYLKYVKETAQKDPAKLAPEVGGIVVGSELIHRGLRRKLKEVKEKNNENDLENLETDSRVGYKKGGITALKSIINFLAKNRGFGPTTGSKSLQELNPKQFGWKFNLLSPELKKSMEQNRLEYLENLSDAIKSDKKLLTDIKNMPKEWQEFMYKSANEGANQGRLDVYKKINIDDAISEIEQMKKNLEFKNLPGKEIKRRMNAEGGVSQGLDYLAGIERRGYAGGSILKTIGKKIIKKTKKPNLKRQLTDDEIDDLAADVGELDAYDFDGTVGSAEKIRKQHKEYMDYMYYQYKTGRLDPKPGEMNTSRMQYLRNKRKQAEMTDDPKLFNPNERDELDNLEETFSPMGTSNKINISDPKTAESFTEFAKQNDPEGFKKIEKIVDDINNKNTLENFDITGRKKNAGGGILKTIGKKLIKKPKKYKFTGEESLNDLYELERQGKITREDMNVYSPRYLEYLDAQIINKEKLYTPKEWEKTPEVLKNKMRGRIDPDWEEANFGEEFNWDQARSIEMKQQKQLQDFDITGRKKNAKGGLNYLMGL